MLYELCQTVENRVRIEKQRSFPEAGTFSLCYNDGTESAILSGITLTVVGAPASVRDITYYCVKGATCTLELADRLLPSGFTLAALTGTCGASALATIVADAVSLRTK